MEREWPKYVATWSIRRQQGDTDYPVQTGRLERMPPADPSELDGILDELRAEALQEAKRAAGRDHTTESDKEGKSLLGRLFGRR